MHKSFYEATKTPDGLKRVLELIKADYEGRLCVGQHGLYPKLDASFGSAIDEYSCEPELRPLKANELFARVGATIIRKLGAKRYVIASVTAGLSGSRVNAYMVNASGVSVAREIPAQELFDEFTQEDGSPLGVPNA